MRDFDEKSKEKRIKIYEKTMDDNRDDHIRYPDRYGDYGLSLNQ